MLEENHRRSGSDMKSSPAPPPNKSKILSSPSKDKLQMEIENIAAEGQKKLKQIFKKFAYRTEKS